jgi:proline iminopeptidase
MRFYDPRFNALPLFAEAEFKPQLFEHILGRLTSTWNVSIGREELRVPILLAHGRYDYAIPYTMWNGITETLPDATLHLFERSGHQTFFEEPERFAEVVRAWMVRTVQSAGQ